MKMRKEKGIILKLDFEKAYDRVSWSFLEEVLRTRNFSPTWIEWIMKSVRRGRIAIDINGERVDFFRSFKGMRQGDPLSPVLFNFVGFFQLCYALSVLLEILRG